MRAGVAGEQHRRPSSTPPLHSLDPWRVLRPPHPQTLKPSRRWWSSWRRRRGGAGGAPPRSSSEPWTSSAPSTPRCRSPGPRPEAGGGRAGLRSAGGSLEDGMQCRRMRPPGAAGLALILYCLPIHCSGAVPCTLGRQSHANSGTVETLLLGTDCRRLQLSDKCAAKAPVVASWARVVCAPLQTPAPTDTVELQDAAFEAHCL